MNATATRLQVPPDEAYLQIVGSYVAAVARRTGLPEREVAQVRWAVREACQNVIDHVEPNGGISHFQITCETNAEQLRIAIWDPGPPFDLAGVPRPDLQADVTKRRIGGLGLYLMGRLMDEVQLRPCSQGKELLLVKYTDPVKGKRPG